jgi:hypothetical protein
VLQKRKEKKKGYHFRTVAPSKPFKARYLVKRENTKPQATGGQEQQEGREKK